jgi:uncharacterized protein (TIGR03435 family)
MAGLPSWIDEARFDINARAAIDNPTKDQFRLMVQSLLADRFKLAMHHATRQLPIFELALSKPVRRDRNLHIMLTTPSVARKGDRMLRRSRVICPHSRVA